MRYRTEKTPAGKWQAVITNPTFNLQKIFTYETEAEALERVELERVKSEAHLSGIVSVSDYFKSRD